MNKPPTEPKTTVKSVKNVSVPHQWACPGNIFTLLSQIWICTGHAQASFCEPKPEFVQIDTIWYNMGHGIIL